MRTKLIFTCVKSFALSLASELNEIQSNSNMAYYNNVGLFCRDLLNVGIAKHYFIAIIQENYRFPFSGQQYVHHCAPSETVNVIRINISSQKLQYETTSSQVSFLYVLNCTRSFSFNHTLKVVLEAKLVIFGSCCM